MKIIQTYLEYRKRKARQRAAMIRIAEYMKDPVKFLSTKSD